MIKDGWKEMNLEANDYVFERTISEESYLYFKDRDATVLNLFLTFYDEKLIEKICGKDPWQYKPGRFLSIKKLKMRVVYQFLAIVVRITGKREKIPLETALREALDHFPKKTYHYGEDVMRKLLSSFLITPDLLLHLSANFQSVVQSYGQYLSGDEKLFGFTGHRRC